MKNYFPLLIATLLFFSCSSDDDSINDESDVSFEDKQVRVEMNALTDNLENYENTSIELFFNGYEEPEVESNISADSTSAPYPDFKVVDKDFYYSFSALKDTLTFSTVYPVISGVFGFDTYMKEELQEDQDIYEVKIYHDDELFDTKIISGESGDTYIGEVFYLLEGNVL